MADNGKSIDEVRRNNEQKLNRITNRWASFSF